MTEYGNRIDLVDILPVDNAFYDERILDDVNDIFQVNDVSFLENCDNDAIYILASSIYLGDFYDLLHSKGIERIIPYHALLLMNLVFEGTKYTYRKETFLEAMSHIVNNNIRYADMLTDISDDMSREFLAKTIIYRLTASVECLAKAGSFQQNIYFDQSFLPYRNKEDVFVDVGGYCGDTLSSFLKFYKNDYKRYYFFEPEKNLVEQARKIVSDDNDKIIFYPIGIYNKKDILRFQANGKGIGSIDQEGQTSIAVDTIDNIIQEPPTYIKIVVEGSEMEALQGAENTIKHFKPVIAVACYHKPSHLLDLYEFLKGLNKDYHFYIRSGFNSLYNTITLFAVNRPEI